VGSGSEAAFPVVESEPGLEVHSGDLLIIDRAVAPSIGRLVLVATEGELVLRRFTEHEGKRYVVGGEGKVLPLEGDGEVVCWGVVKAVVRNV
jgi:DNA polymerase V